MTLLLHGDCLEHLESMEPNSVDLIFCDLPYGQTSCKWDCPIDLDILWNHFMRVKKLNTPIIMTCTTKFGVSLINSAPKKCPFRYDLVWCKSSPCGFLSAKKMPMRKHEMIYVFYEKLPFYDLSSHKHKFIKETENKRSGKDGVDNKGMIKNRSKKEIATTYEPPLPTSLVKENCNYDVNKNAYGGGKEGRIKISKDKKDHVAKYDPPLPTSIITEVVTEVTRTDKGCNALYGNETGKKFYYDQNGKLRNSEPRYDPPLPTSLVKGQTLGDKGNECYGKFSYYNNGVMGYEPPLPNSLLEVKSTRGKHSTEKPVDLMKWILKYYSKEGDVILDATMGSGSMGVACEEMKRNFIGIEKDEEIFNVAWERLNPEN